MLRVDRAVHGGHGDLLLVRQHLRVEDVRVRAIEADDAQEAVGVYLVFELVEEAVEGPNEAIRTIGAQLAGVEHGSRGLDRRDDELGGNLVVTQQRVERCPPRDTSFDRLELGREQNVRAGTARGLARGRAVGLRAGDDERRRERERIQPGHESPSSLAHSAGVSRSVGVRDPGSGIRGIRGGGGRDPGSADPGSRTPDPDSVSSYCAVITHTPHVPVWRL